MTTSRSKPTAASQDDEEERPPSNGPPPAADLKTPPGVSPQGRMLRSGRNKRRRSRTSPDGATLDQEEKPAKRRAKESEDSSARPTRLEAEENVEGSRETMDEEESDDEVTSDMDDDSKNDETMDEAIQHGENGQEHAQSQLQVHVAVEPSVILPPAAAVAPVAVVAAPIEATNGSRLQPTKKLAPITKLRMPSQHTPGKLQTTAPSRAYVESRRLRFDTPSRVLNPIDAPSPPEVQRQAEELRSILAEGSIVLQEDDVQEEELSLTMRWYQSMSSTVIDAATTIQQVTTTLVLPQPTDRYAQNGDDDDDVEVMPKASPLMRADLWFVLILFLQLIFWPIWINPVLNTVMESSDMSLQFYKSFFGSSIILPKNDTIMVSTVKEKPSVVDPKANDLENISKLLETLDATSLQNSNHRALLEQQLGQARMELQDRLNFLITWHEALQDVEALLQSIVTASTAAKNLVPQLVGQAETFLEVLETVVPSPLSMRMTKATAVPLWESPTPSSPSSCPDTPLSLKDPLLTREKLELMEEDLLARASATLSIIMTDPSKRVRSWIRGQLKEVVQQTNLTVNNNDRPPKAPSMGLTQDAIQKVIMDRLEIERADQTGRKDYASLPAGATVIHSGSRSTSPSLVDNLPLVNRLMERAKLRFYGYGPEAALTPTYPSDSLGQCWAFENVAQSKNGRWRYSNLKDRSCGTYGTLTIQLPQPIRVTSVVVEHAPKEITDQFTSAIRDFRVIGYEDADANGPPLALGSFRYDIDAERTLQEFEVESSVDDMPIPLVHAVTLAIDTNWGFPYSCLYRFRVHGEGG